MEAPLRAWRDLLRGQSAARLIVRFRVGDALGQPLLRQLGFRESRQAGLQSAELDGRVDPEVAAD